MTALNQAQFAKHIGVARSYVTQLKTKGHLVMTEDGLVDVEASKQRIEELKDPSKQALADRHQASRDKTAPADSDKSDNHEKAGVRYQDSRAVKEKYHALAAKRDYEISIGKLMQTNEVLQVVANAGVVFRSRFESLPDILAPQLAAETDEQKIRLLLHEHIEQQFKELSAQFQKLSKKRGIERHKIRHQRGKLSGA